MSMLPEINPPRRRAAAVDVNQIGDALRSRTVSTGGAGLVQHRSGGIIIGRRPRGYQTGRPRGLQPHPFQVTAANVTSGEDAGAYVTVRFGQVSNLTPTIDSVALDHDPRPALEVVSGVVYLRVTVDEFGDAESAVIENAATVPDDTATDGHLVLATVVVTTPEGETVPGVTAVNQSVTRSLEHMLCGERHLFGGL